MRTGSTSHRDLFCRTFIETHVPFEPAQLAWPELSPDLLAFMRALPIWTFARSVERRAGRMVTAFSETLDDPVIREAVALQGYEEARHGRILDEVFARYGIDASDLDIADDPPTSDAFATFGFGECRDSFIGFGAIALAREAGLVPPDLIAIFEQVLFEEARHIVFFMNWFTYESVRRGENAWQRLRAEVMHHVRAITGAAQAAQSGPPMDFPVDALAPGLKLSPADFLQAALRENRRLMQRLDSRLLRPRLVPTLATAALLGIRMLPPREHVKPRISLAA